MPHETPINSKKTGGFALFDSLVQNGTRYIFGYPGGAILPLYDELYFWEEQNLIKHIFIPLCENQQNHYYPMV